MRFPTTLTFLASVTLMHAQGKERTFKTDSGTVVLHYFTDGKVSTKVWTHGPDYRVEGRSWAFDHSGKVLVEWHTRTYAGHSSMDRTYHPNGAVNKVEVSTAPDGGIQWYRGTYTFDDQGKQTGFMEQGHDNDGLIPSPGVRVMMKPEVTVPFKQEEVREQHMFVNEIFVVNSTKWACVLTAKATDPSPGLTGGTFTLRPGDTLRVGMYSKGEVFPPPAKHVTLLAQRPNGKGRKRSPMELVLLQQKQASPEHRKYFYHALPEGTRLKIAP